MTHIADESTGKRLEDEVKRYRDLHDEANRQIASMMQYTGISVSDFVAV